MKGDKITKDTAISEILSEHPEAAEVFFKHGMHCIGCIASQFESLGEAALAHGIDLNKLLKDLNSKIGAKKTRK